jgi:hypothetical protein
MEARGSMKSHVDASREVQNWTRVRDEWLATLNKNPNSIDAANKIAKCNAYIELFTTWGMLDGN